MNFVGEFSYMSCAVFKCILFNTVSWFFFLMKISWSFVFTIKQVAWTGIHINLIMISLTSQVESDRLRQDQKISEFWERQWVGKAHQKQHSRVLDNSAHQVLAVEATSTWEWMPSTYGEKYCVVACLCYPSSEKMETAGSMEFNWLASLAVFTSFKLS